jgi:hypothetical protein
LKGIEAENVKNSLESDAYYRSVLKRIPFLILHSSYDHGFILIGAAQA